jgi:beta-N-acetylhexosaminidase
MMFKVRSLSLLLFLLISTRSFSQTYDAVKARQWVDSVFVTMSPDERIGQLFMIAAYSNRDSTHVKEISELIREYHIGGLCFFQGGPVRQATHCNYYQSQSRIPLLVSMDAEFGIAMRLDSCVRFPKQMALGAITNDTLIYDFGAEVAHQFKRIGMHLNFAPVVDVNNNPKNPVINDRSFGENKYKVASKGIAYMEGMQDNGVLANAKHFPGHGNTDQDSHFTLPTISKSKEEIDSLELYPFKELFKRGLSSVMVAHLNIPSIDNSNNIASTLSKAIVTDLLKDEMKFNGLVFTDALNMRGVSAYFAPGVVDEKALLAGNDVLLLSENVPSAFKEIKNALDLGLITMDEIDSRAKKVLLAKYIVGLDHYEPVQLDGLYDELNSNEAKVLSMKLYANALTLLANKKNLIPFKNLEYKSFAALSIGADIDNEFLNMCKNYAPVQTFAMKKDASLNDFDFLEKSLESYNTVIVGIHDMTRNESKNFSISMQTRDFLGKLSQRANVIVVVFGNAYSLRNFDNLAPLLLAYEDNEYTRSCAAQALFGGIAIQGTLPVTPSEVFKAGDGFIIEKPIRLKYALPEEAGIRAIDLKKIDEIAQKAITEKATPGCQVLVAKDGIVIYSKSFGTRTYNDSVNVKNSDLYDIASLTKILSTNLGVMKMYDEGKLDLKKRIAAYAPVVKGSNKSGLRVGDILAHRAGLKPFIPFWKNSLIDGNNYSTDSSSFYSIRVADKMYLRNNYSLVIWKEILESEVKNDGKYVYSDLGFYLMKEAVENHYKEKINTYTDKVFYKTLGLSTMTYNPKNKFYTNRLIPTEEDKDFRKQLLVGDVHDQGAAMLGGVGGHAGLFSNANDVAIVMQMLLNKGTYGGAIYFKPETVQKFTTQYAPSNRRGLGFDKPEPDPAKSSPAAKGASLATFGHTGFTGTCTWVDPEYNLVYVFLSNRINPSVDNKKLIEMNVRTDIQQVIYDAIQNNR